MTTRKPVFIEKIMPVKLLNEQVYHEHGGNPFKGLHRWYSRKPLSFSRASVLGSLLPDEVSIEEFEYLLGLEWRKYRNKETKLYKTPPSPERIARVQELCEQQWGTRTPVVLDAFAGGGSIPFEAARYGLKVLASDLNPVAVVTMKAAIEYPLKFGADLQQDIDKWVKWVGDEAEKRLAEFFPSLPNEKVQTYFWAHTVVCPSCQSSIPLLPNGWLSRTTNYAGKGNERKATRDWYAVKLIAQPEKKQVGFDLVQGRKGKGSTIQVGDDEYEPEAANTISRGIGKCPNCHNIVEDEVIKACAQSTGLGHQLYAIAYKKGKTAIEFRLPSEVDLQGFNKAVQYLEKKRSELERLGFIPVQEVPSNTHRGPDMYLYGIHFWNQMFNPRQLLSLSVYSEIIDEAIALIQQNYDQERSQAITTYLALVLDRCVDKNCRLAHWDATALKTQPASAQHSLSLFWNYPESDGTTRLWSSSVDCISDYGQLCQYLDSSLGSQLIQATRHTEGNSFDGNRCDISLASADSLLHIDSGSVDIVVTDPPYYDSIRYGEISDFFYVWLRVALLKSFPDLFFNELTDKDNEAIANPGRFRNMGISPEELANQDYEAKMALAFAEYHRVLRDDGVMTVQFNHKDSGAWDVLAKSLIDAGFEVTASWSVSTENPQNLHQAQKNSVSSTVLLVCRKRDPQAGQAWWDDLRPQVANLVEHRAPEFEANEINGIDLYLSAFGPALNVFSRHSPILDTSGNEVRPEEAFSEARKAVANYRFRKLAQTDTLGFDPLTTWYILAWDAFRAREFPFDEARQLALAVGGFNVTDLAKTHKLLDSTSGICKLLTPDQRFKKRAFSTNPEDFTLTSLIDGLHAVIAVYLEEQSIDPVRRFLKTTGLLSNDLFIRAWEVTLRVIPHIGDDRKRMPEEKALADLWLAMDEIKAKVRYEQPELDLGNVQQSLF
ncbi:hypothetical protein LEP3755_65980 (plasmid) [Leptolyngbya sp. NIES-3755]|nr:hypothetical protein LEP3755_65980 [Leptolyngbya sp. NIES-3755]